MFMQNGDRQSEISLDAPLEQDLSANDLLQHFHPQAAFPRELDVLQGRDTRAVFTTHGRVHHGKRLVSQLPGVVQGFRPSVGTLLEHA